MNHIELEKRMFDVRLELFKFVRDLEKAEIGEDEKWYREKINELKEAVRDLRGKMMEIIEYIERNYYEV